MQLRMPQTHGPIQHRRTLGPGLQTIQAHGPPTLGPVPVGHRSRGPSPRRHGVGQRGNPSGEGTKQVGKIGLDGKKNGRHGRIHILWKALGGSAKWDGADFYASTTSREAIKRIRRILDPEHFPVLDGSSLGNFLTCSNPKKILPICTNLGCPISVSVLQGM